jgi:hypothetical protein
MPQPICFPLWALACTHQPTARCVIGADDERYVALFTDHELGRLWLAYAGTGSTLLDLAKAEDLIGFLSRHAGAELVAINPRPHGAESGLTFLLSASGQQCSLAELLTLLAPADTPRAAMLAQPDDSNTLLA